MKILTKSEGNKVVLEFQGRLDTVTAPEAEATLNNSIVEAEELILDFGNLDYISSAGLRVLLSAQKKMQAKAGSMMIQNVNDTIKEVFEVTGFVDILTIQ